MKTAAPAIATVATLSLALLIVAPHGLPLLGGDAMYFSPTAVEWAQSGELANKLYAHAWVYDCNARFVYYPPLAPLVVGSALYLLSQPTLPQVGLAIMSCLAMALSVGAMWASFFWGRSAPAANEIPWTAASFLAAFAFSTFAVLMSVWGRPESVTLLFVGFFALIFFSTREPVRPALFAAGLGLTAAGAAASQLVIGTKLFLIATMAILSWADRRRALHFLIASSAAALGFFAVLAVLAPVSLPALAKGIREHAAAVLFTAPALWGYLWSGSQMNLPGWYAVYLLGMATLLWQVLPKRWSRPGEMLAWTVALGAYLFIEWRFTILQPPATYNAATLLPIAEVALGMAALRVQDIAARRAALGAVAVLAMLVGSGSFRVMYLAYNGLLRGPSVAEAREFVTPYVRGNSVGVTNGIWPIFESYTNVRCIEGRDLQGDLRFPYDVVIVQQFNHSNITKLPGFEEVASLKLGGPVQLFGSIRIANSPMAYQLRVFRQQKRQ